VIEQFNRILQGFGGNRVRVTGWGNLGISFDLVGWSSFRLWRNGEVHEWDGETYQATTRSVWLEDVSKGKTRNDAGVLS
jgi:hypothetical protein